MPNTSAAYNAADAVAASPDVWQAEQTADGEAYLVNARTGERIVRAYGFDEHGNVVEKELVSYAQERNETATVNLPASETNDVPDAQNIASPRLLQKAAYSETEIFTGLGPEERITAEFEGPCLFASVINSVPVSDSFAIDPRWDPGVAALITRTTALPWVAKATASISVTADYEVPAGDIGYITFTPRLQVTEGVVEERTDTAPLSHRVWAACPVVLPDGQADGVFEIRLR